MICLFVNDSCFVLFFFKSFYNCLKWWSLSKGVTVSPCDVFSVQAAQEAVQQVADSSRETASAGNVHIPLSLKRHDVRGDL